VVLDQLGHVVGADQVIDVHGQGPLQILLVEVQALGRGGGGVVGGQVADGLAGRLAVGLVAATSQVVHVLLVGHVEHLQPLAFLVPVQRPVPLHYFDGGGVLAPESGRLGDGGSGFWGLI
jgi:hypothetical protein